MNHFYKNICLFMGGLIIGGLTAQKAILKAVISRRPFAEIRPNELEYDAQDDTDKV